MASSVGTTQVGIGASLGLIGILVAVFWYQALDRDLSEPPRREAARLTPSVPPSLLSLNVTLPFERLEAAAEAASPSTYDGSGNGPDVCTNLGIRVCVGTKYDFTATRGPVSLSAGPDNSIRISMPLKVTGHGGFRGGGARLLRLDAKPFEATTEAFADLTLDLSPDWCPKVQVNADFSNLSARVEIVSHTWVGVGSLVEGSVREQLRKIGERAGSVLNCEDLRRTVQAAWVTRSFPLPLPADPRPLHVNLEPLSVGFSGVQVTSHAAQLRLSLGARVSVSDAPIDFEKRPLPALDAVPLKPGAIQLALPLRISYEGLETHLESLLTGKPFSFTTPAGAATMTTDQLTVYPAGERIVVGAHVTAKLPGHFLSTRGWVYLTARPVVSPDGKSVRLADIAYSRILDSELARILTVLLDGEIRDRLVAAGQFDLSPTIAKAKELLKSGLAQHSGKVAVETGDPSLRLGRIVPGGGALFVEGLFTSKANVVFLSTR
jgi:hypothetical protein